MCLCVFVRSTIALSHQKKQQQQKNSTSIIHLVTQSLVFHFFLSTRSDSSSCSTGKLLVTALLLCNHQHYNHQQVNSIPSLQCKQCHWCCAIRPPSSLTHAHYFRPHTAFSASVLVRLNISKRGNRCHYQHITISIITQAPICIVLHLYSARHSVFLSLSLLGDIYLQIEINLSTECKHTNTHIYIRHHQEEHFKGTPPPLPIAQDAASVHHTFLNTLLN